MQSLEISELGSGLDVPRPTHYIRGAVTCLVVVGRGTSDPDANSEIAKLCRMLEEGMGFGASFVCYSGTAKPLVADGLRAAVRLGHPRLIVLPFLLFDGILVKRVYDAAAALAARHPDLEVLTTHYMGVHPDIADVFLARAHEGVEGHAHMNYSLCKYRVQIVGFERQVGEPQRSALGICRARDRKSTRLNSSHVRISYATLSLIKKTNFYSAVRLIS